jgi:hypothetical protein
MIKNYDVHVHADRVSKMLERYKTCGRGVCPLSISFRVRDGFPKQYEEEYGKNPYTIGTHNHSGCRVCRQFIRMHWNNEGCPCLVYGAGVAMAKTEAALSRYYKKHGKGGSK